MRNLRIILVAAVLLALLPALGPDAAAGLLTLLVTVVLRIAIVAGVFLLARTARR